MRWFRNIVLVSMIMALIFVMLGCASLKDKVDISMPNETSATGFWSPKTGDAYLGVCHSVARVQHKDFDKVSLDLDGTLAREVGDDADTMAGIGTKLNYNVKSTKPGVNLLPSIGSTLVTNMNNVSTPKNMLTDMEFLFYGTFFMWKW